MKEGAASCLIGNTRIEIHANGLRSHKVYLTLCYSRPVTSRQDFREFYGFDIHERVVPRVEYTFNADVAQEIQSLGPLPSPIDLAFHYCKARAIGQKWQLNAIRMGMQQLAPEVVRNGMSMPAVLIGNAAHALPDICSAGSINAVISDAMKLCDMIVDRYENNQAFARIPEDHHSGRVSYWQSLILSWEYDWLKAHGMPYERSAKGTRWAQWVKLEATYRENKVQSETNYRENNAQSEASNLGDDRKDLQRFQEREAARWDQVQQRIRDRLERRGRISLPPGVEPTKLVVRYIDSSSLQDEGDEAKGERKHGTDDSKPRAPTT